jgi:hypothetical protein
MLVVASHGSAGVVASFCECELYIHISYIQLNLRKEAVGRLKGARGAVAKAAPSVGVLRAILRLAAEK